MPVFQRTTAPPMSCILPSSSGAQEKGGAASSVQQNRCHLPAPHRMANDGEHPARNSFLTTNNH